MNHYGLGYALHAKGRLDEAMGAYREAIHLKMDYADAHCGLGNVLQAKGQLDEAVAAYREAIALQPDVATYHYNLGNALRGKGRLDEAIGAFRAAIRLKKDYAQAHNNLGNALQAKGQLDEAIAAFRAAIRIKKDLPEAHRSLGSALYAKGQLDDAIAAWREAIRLKKDYPGTYVNLGVALRIKGRLDEASAAYRAAIHLKKDYAEAHCNLGLVLQQQGLFRQALEELRRGHELGFRSPRWPYPSAQWVRQCERLIELDGQLPDILAGKTTPAGPAERIELAGLCSLKQWHHAAARFYEDAFAAQPTLADVLGAHRYNAACAAALAGCGQGNNAPTADPERARLRGQALVWLQGDLTVWRQRLDKEPDKARPAGLTQMRRWLVDPDLAGVRGEAIAQLPEAERQPWQKLWDDVADALARATPEKKPGAK
jgi:tetratricopeptide (TPR) repeat protein